VNTDNGAKQTLHLPPKITRHVYPLAGFRVGGPELIPELPGIEINGESPSVIQFESPGEVLCFLFTEDGKRELVKQLTGGIQIAQPGDVTT
jgi:hypothetical protein